MQQRARSFIMLVSATVLIGFVLGGMAYAGGAPRAAELTGAAEAPGPGDPDGSGFALITLNHGQGTVCWELAVADIAPATAAHIHVAPPGDPGPVVVPLTPPTTGTSSGCAFANRDLIKKIIQNPDEYYVNVHNAAFPAGAVRGQLSNPGLAQ